MFTVIDATGRRVARLGNGRWAAGRSELVWDGRDESGAGLPSAVYLARLTVGEHVMARKLLLLK